MKNLKKQRRIQIIAIAAVALVLATALIGYGMRDGINFFRSPSEVMADPPRAGEIFRLGGMVKEGSIAPGEGHHFSFVLSDGGEEIAVDYVGNSLKPDIFGEGQGSIAMGSMNNGRFEATEILAKHDETYMPREVADALKKHNKDLPNPTANAEPATY